MVAEDIGNRCGKCYELRLFEAARQAKEGGFDSFTSSLFISPYQNHELMRETAERAAFEYGVEFHTVISAPISGRDRRKPGSWAFTCRNTAAVCSQKKRDI